MGMIEKASGEERGLGEERKGSSRRLLSFSIVCTDVYKLIACKQTPGEEAKKKIDEQSEPTSAKLKNSEREVRQPVLLANEPEPPSGTVNQSQSQSRLEQTTK